MKIIKSIKYLCVMIIFISCEEKSISNDQRMNNVKSIADTLHYGSFYDSIGEDEIIIRVINANTGLELTRLYEGQEYYLNFTCPLLKNYRLLPEISEGADLKKINDSDAYHLQVYEKTEDYLEFYFEFDLGMDSILVMNRNWVDSSRNSYYQNISGFYPYAKFKIAVAKIDEKS